MCRWGLSPAKDARPAGRKWRPTRKPFNTPYYAGDQRCAPYPDTGPESMGGTGGI